MQSKKSQLDFMLYKCLLYNIQSQILTQSCKIKVHWGILHESYTLKLFRRLSVSSSIIYLKIYGAITAKYKRSVIKKH